MVVLRCSSGPEVEQVEVKVQRRCCGWLQPPCASVTGDVYLGVLPGKAMGLIALVRGREATDGLDSFRDPLAGTRLPGGFLICFLPLFFVSLSPFLKSAGLKIELPPVGPFVLLLLLHRHSITAAHL